MTEFRRIAVYCGSSEGVSTEYKNVARDLGHYLASEGIGLVYGGGGVGLMNAVAQGALTKGGEVVGVITEKLSNMELGRSDLTQMHVVKTMRERKAMMADLADGFIALPGGFGTLEELFEVTTLTQLRVHLKPIGLLNTNGYYDPLITFLSHAVDEGFIRPVHRHLIAVEEHPSPLLIKMARQRVPEFHEWLDQS